MHNRLLLRTVPLLLLACASSTLAQTAASPGVEVWLDPGLFSLHLKRNQDFREDNTGFGIGVFPTPEHGFLAGSFINSDRERSHYAAWHWRPWQWARTAPLRISAGLIVGLIDGYSNTNAGNAFPLALPVVSAEYGPIGANLSFIPHPQNGAAIALQLRLRVW